MSEGEAALGQLIIDIDGYEGPLDVLLTLARTQKVDLRHISILELVKQYLAFVAEMGRLRLELAADYLVMAAWLAYLKSRLLLPPDEEEQPSAEDLAARLAHQLARLEAMREAAARLMARNRLGRDVFARGNPEGVRVVRTALYDVTLYDLLKAYADHSARTRISEMKIPRVSVYSLDEAIARLERMLGHTLDWTALERFLPASVPGPRGQRSATASLFVAALELARQGRADIRQGEAFGPLYVRPRAPDSLS